MSSPPKPGTLTGSNRSPDETELGGWSETVFTPPRDRLNSDGGRAPFRPSCFEGKGRRERNERTNDGVGVGDDSVACTVRGNSH